MNIFALDKDPHYAARYHVDKHVVKMILETCQLLSTAHRMLDGDKTIIVNPVGKKKTVYLLQSETYYWQEYIDTIMYETPDGDIVPMSKINWKLILSEPFYIQTHVNHPSAIWCRANSVNYAWLYSLLIELCKEYTHRYGKVHKCASSGLVAALGVLPKNISYDGILTYPTPAMPEQYKSDDVIQSYRNYYNGDKVRMFSWKNREKPYWITT